MSILDFDAELVKAGATVKPLRDWLPCR